MNGVCLMSMLMSAADRICMQRHTEYEKPMQMSVSALILCRECGVITPLSRLSLSAARSVCVSCSFPLSSSSVRLLLSAFVLLFVFHLCCLVVPRFEPLVLQCREWWRCSRNEDV